MKKHITSSLVFVLSSTLLICSCKKNKQKMVSNPQLPDQEELITTFQITFTDPMAVNPAVTAIFSDSDGPGGNAPAKFDTIRLKPNATYNASITLSDESKNPTEDITAEIHEEGKDHLFCFIPSTVLGLGITLTDSDGTHPIGLKSQWITQGAGTGQTIIKLKHQPGVKNGQCEPGETDIELSFHTIVQ